jgi:hypothetical protein
MLSLNVTYIQEVLKDRCELELIVATLLNEDKRSI